MSRADAKLDGRDIFGQILLGDQRQQVAVSGERGPRRERDKSRLQDQTRFAEKGDDREEVGARMAFCQTLEDGVVHGLDCADDKEAASVAQLRQMVGVPQAGARS